MSIDHFHVQMLGDYLEFNEGSLTTQREKDFELIGSTVYVGLQGKAVSGTIEVKFTVTDSDSGTADDNKTTAETDWQEWINDNIIEIDTSGLTSGAATIKFEANGEGQVKDIYMYQE